MIIELKNAKKEYIDGKNKSITPLNGVNLSVEKGEYVAIIGPSGAGKSTLLNIIGCIDSLTSGEYSLDGKNIECYTKNQQADIRKQYIGYILQNNGLISYRNVYDNVAIPLMFNKKVKKKEYKEKIEAALLSVGMQNYRNRRVNELSGGEKQRIAIARALVNNPDIILADEPTGALDIKNKVSIVELLFQLKSKGKTLLMVTHDMEIANEFKIRYSFTNEGVLSQVGGTIC